MRSRGREGATLVALIASMALPGRGLCADGAYVDIQAEVRQLIGCLVGRDDSRVRGAARTLGCIGPAAAEAVPRLLELLSRKGVHSEARHALAAIGVAAVAGLTEQLSSQSPDVRADAAQALAKIGPAAREAVPALASLLDDRETWSWARDALSSIGRDAVPVLVGALQNADPEIRSRAAYALGRMGPDAKAAIPALVRAFEDPNEPAKRRAIQALGWIGPSARVAVPALVRQWDATDFWKQRQAVAGALGGIGLSARPAAGVLRRGMAADTSLGRTFRAEALLRMYPTDRAALACLGEILLEDPSPRARVEVAYRLGELGSAAKRAVPALVKALTDAEASVRRKSAEALGHIGSDAARAVSALARMLHNTHEDAGVRRTAAWALGEIGSASVPALVRIVSDRDDPIARDAARALGRIGLTARDAVPALMRAVSSGSPDLCRDAIGALARTGPSPDVLHALTEALKGKWIYRDAAEALAEMAPAHREVIPILVGMLGDERSHLRRCAAEGLAKFGRGAKEAIPALRKALKDGSALVRILSARALAEIEGTDRPW